MAAQEGLESSRVANQIETFIASQAANTRFFSTSAKEIMALTVLDLALTMGQNYQKSINLCDIAMKYLKSCKKLDNTGHFRIISSIHKLLYSGKLCLSVRDLLQDAAIPLSLKDWKSKHTFWKELENRLKEFRLSQSSEDGKNVSSGQSIYRQIIELCGNDRNYLHRVFSHLEVVSEIYPQDEGAFGKKILSRKCRYYSLF